MDITSKLAAICLVLSACASGADRPYFAWQDNSHPEAVLADGSTDPVWTQMVEDARALWSGPLVAMGCDDPFRGDAVRTVTLVPNEQWTLPADIGETNSWGIIVKGTVDTMIDNKAYETVLPHELGHAIGLVHVVDDSDAESVMHPVADHTRPSEADLQNAAALLGCN